MAEGRITRNSIALDAAAKQASDAARVMQARQQEIKAEKAAEPEPETKRDDPRGDPERVKARNPARTAAMESIRANRGEKEPEPEPEPKADPSDEKAKPFTQTSEKAKPFDQTSAAQEPAGTVQPEKPADAVPVAAEPIKTVRVKVDGEEFDAPQAEVEEYGGIKAYQISKASENRLKKANEALAQARQMQEAVAQFSKQNMPQPAPKLSFDEFVASKADAIRYGTPQEFAIAMKEIKDYGNPPPIDQNMVTNQAVMQMNYQNGVKGFLTEFQDLATNPLLMKLTETIARERIATLPQDPVSRSQVDWSDFYRRIGNEVRSVVGRSPQPASAAVVPTTDTPSPVSPDKEARKSSIVNLPTAATRATLPEAEKPETREQSLERMKKARGIQTG